MKRTYKKNVASTLVSLDILWRTLAYFGCTLECFGMRLDDFGSFWMTLDDSWRQWSLDTLEEFFELAFFHVVAVVIVREFSALNFL